jgi:hypothetical protein
MLTCKEVARLLSTDTAADGALPDRLRVRLHLLFCKHCRGYAEQLRTVSAAGREIWSECTGERETLDRLEAEILKHSEEWVDSRPPDS